MQELDLIGMIAPVFTNDYIISICSDFSFVRDFLFKV